MVILSNCLTEIVDEGCRKVANTLIKRLKEAVPETLVVSYESRSQTEDVHLDINRWLLSRELAALLRKEGASVLYVPRPANMLPLAIRVFLLSLLAPKEVSVLISMGFPVGNLAKWLLKASRANVITISNDTYEYYAGIFGGKVSRIKVGIDPVRFAPNVGERRQLKEKYGIPADKPVILHVGHLRPQRNIEVLLNLEESMHAVLVVSTQTANEQDAALRQRLSERENITILDSYIPNIEEVYQCSDVYLFPVKDEHACIASPLSALEAAACDLPVVTTAFGELRQLLACEGFYEIESFEPEQLNGLLRRAYEEKKSTRASVLEYDWNMAVRQLLPKEKIGGSAK